MKSAVPTLIRKRRAVRLRVSDLERQLEAQQRKTDEANAKLRSIIGTSVTRNPINGVVTLCVSVDSTRADARSGRVYEVAIDQLITDLRRELSKR